ncbi:MAG: hypothetical protein ACLFRU_02835 [Paracoccaceae bacterium]
MHELKTAILNARYIDMMELAAAVSEAAERAPKDDTELAGPRAQAIAAALFRWAADDIEGEPR